MKTSEIARLWLNGKPGQRHQDDAVNWVAESIVKELVNKIDSWRALIETNSVMQVASCLVVGGKAMDLVLKDILPGGCERTEHHVLRAATDTAKAKPTVSHGPIPPAWSGHLQQVRKWHGILAAFNAPYTEAVRDAMERFLSDNGIQVRK